MAQDFAEFRLTFSGFQATVFLQNKTPEVRFRAKLYPLSEKPSKAEDFSLKFEA